jgi:hypothetical protein
MKENNMARIDTLENVKVGDVFYYKKTRGERCLMPVKCEKVTPKYAFIGGCKYRKENAKEIHQASRNIWHDSRELYDAQETFN